MPHQIEHIFASSGCYSTLRAAVAASPNDTINVSNGEYFEDVVIDKSLSLVGTGRSSTIINARGLPNGISIDGYHNAARPTYW